MPAFARNFPARENRPVTAEQRFWQWFIEHESELYRLQFETSGDREHVFDELSAQIRQLDPHLTFEMGSQGSKCEFIISADGIKDAFSAVLKLFRAAPKLERWHVTAFRPRRTALRSVELADKKIAPEDVTFSLLSNGSLVGIHLFIPGFREQDASYKSIGYLLLDESLGEYDVETRVGLIRMFPIDAPHQFERHPLPKLAEMFDKLNAQLSRQSEQPS